LEKDDKETNNSLLKAAGTEIKLAEEDAKIWADNETITHAEKALAFLSKLKQKDKETEKLRYEAYYFKWHALYSKTKEEARKTVDILAEITDFFTNDDTKLSKSLRTRTAMCYTLHFSYKKAENYFFEKSVTNNSFSDDEEDKIEEYAENQDYDKAYEIYLISQVDDNNIDNEEILLSLGTSALNHSSGLFLEKADEFLTKAYMIFDDEGDHLMTTITSYHTGIVKFKLEKFKQAKFYLEKARIRYERWNWGIEYIDKLLVEINKTTTKQ